MKSVKQFRIWASLSIAVLLGGAVCGCGENKTAVAAEAKPASTYFPVAVGGQTVQLQIAARPNEMMYGLMNRRDLKPDQGMIFVYPKPERMSFYMRNTPTPLDIGFFTSDGALREVYPMYPFDETTINSKSDRIQFSIEMNQGWYQQNGVKPGAKLDLKALSAALKARGIEPKEFGLAP